MKTIMTFTAELPDGVEFLRKVISIDEAIIRFGHPVVRYDFTKLGKPAECYVPTTLDYLENDFEDNPEVLDNVAVIAMENLELAAA